MMQVLFSSQYNFWSGDGGWIHQPPTTRLCFTLAPKPKTDPFQHGKSIGNSEVYICGICSSRYFYGFPFRNPYAMSIGDSTRSWIDFVFLFCRMNWPILVVLLERSDRLAQFEQKPLNNMVQNDHLANTT